MSVREHPSKAAPVTVSGKRVLEMTFMDKAMVSFPDTTLNIFVSVVNKNLIVVAVLTNQTLSGPYPTFKFRYS
jgi:hypothetical protein